MKKSTIFIFFFLLIVLLITFGEASIYIPEDTLGMNSGEYSFYQKIQSSDLIVTGTSFDTKSFNDNGSIQTSSKILIKEILKEENISTVTSGMTIEAYVLGGTVDNISACLDDALCPPPHSGSYEGVFFLINRDISGKGRYYSIDSSSLSIDILKQAISDVKRGLPVKLPDLSLSAQLKKRS
jgi:hypothetical protein